MAVADKLSPCKGCGKLIGADYAFCEECSRIEEQVGAEGEGEVGGRLPLSVRRKYAKAKSVFEVGIWSVKSLNCLFGVMIGSMSEVRNSYDELRLDNRRLRFELKGLGLVYGDCLCPELSPVSHEFTKRDGSRGITVGSLWHCHGFMKFDDRIEARDLHSVLSPLWGKIHGSQVVDIKIIYDEEKAIKYAVKDAVKSYLSDDQLNKRLFKSKKWLPEGYREVDKMLTKWALLHRFDWNVEDSMPDEGYVPRLDFVPMVWEVKRDFLRRWCRGESISLDLGDYKVYIVGESISKYAVMKEGGDSEQLL